MVELCLVNILIVVYINVILWFNGVFLKGIFGCLEIVYKNVKFRDKKFTCICLFRNLFKKNYFQLKQGYVKILLSNFF